MVIDCMLTIYRVMEEGRMDFEDMGDGCMTELQFTGKMMFKVLWDLGDAI